MKNSDVELFQFEASHFNEKARWALDYKSIDHKKRSLLPGFHIPTIKRLTGKTQVPLLRLGDTLVQGSSQIIEALEEKYPDPALYPQEAEQRGPVIGDSSGV